MTKEGWFRYTICEQMSNIGAEVRNYIKARDSFREKKSGQDHSGFYFQKAMEYIGIIEEDPKNIHRIKELEDCKQELIALRAGVFSDAYILKYWDQYTEACAFREQRGDVRQK